jgi:hypothetical protein
MSLTVAVVVAMSALLLDPVDVDGNGGVTNPEIVLEGEQHILGGDVPGTVPARGPGIDPYEYAWASPCGFGPGDDTDLDCMAARQCPPKELLWMLWGRLPGEPWQFLYSDCQSEDGPDEIPDRPRVTPDLVLREVRRIGLPALQVHVQPEGETLVHLDTIFFAEPRPFRRTVQLLGFTVDVEADPASYAWSFGDGAGVTTSTPGGPYPDMSVTHAYTDAHVTEQASVDVTYAVRFRVDGGGWQSLDETVTADGPGTAVAVKEAVPVLSGD